MVKINLLPLEKRRPERTPLPRLLAIYLGVGLTCTLIAVLAWMKLFWIDDAEKQKLALKADWESERTREIQKLNAELEGKERIYRSRKDTIDKLKPPFRWTDVVDILCEKLEAPHKKVWIDEIKVLEANDLRVRQPEIGFLPEGGLLVDAHGVTANPEPLLQLRRDVMQQPKEAAPAGPGARPKQKVLIDYFAGGILRPVGFLLKEQADYTEEFSQNFKIEFYIRPGAAAKK